MESIIENLFSLQDGVIWLTVKWVLIVAAAGFVGQFGKALASYLMGRGRQRKTGLPQSLPVTGLKEDLPRSAALREEPSPGQMEKSLEPAQPEAEPAERLKAGKKELKAQEKRQKKELKNLKKFFT